MKKITIISIIFFSALGFFFVFVNDVFADTAPSASKYGLDNVAPTDIKNVNAEPSEVIGKVIGGVLAFVSVIFFLLTIYGGIIWMTARGNEQQTDKALKTILGAAIGLVIVLGSYVIVGFLFKTVGGG
ncbi:MAG: hypothetical protein Q8P20_05340 [bacterium]|nr:hypothetical protein [bacterium]